MTNFRAAVLDSVLAGTTATFLLVERKSRLRLQEEIHSLQELRAQLSEAIRAVGRIPRDHKALCHWKNYFGWIYLDILGFAWIWLDEPEKAEG